MIIQRPKVAKRINEVPKWTLVYGRRKTGKTFLVRKIIKSEEYFFIKTDRSILTKDNKLITYETFIELLDKSLKNNQTVVVDEFHRLGNDFFDFLHFTEKHGKLILISSTLFLSKKLITNKSPLLGLFAEVPVSLISLEDSLNAIKSYKISKKELLEIAVLLREPIAVDYFKENTKIKEIIATIVLDSQKTIPALVGEIFLEEQRELSKIYEGILRAVSMGKINSGEISSYLFSRKLIKKDDPSVIQQYLLNLISFGILKRIEVYNKKRFVYKIASPLTKIYYYADEKYNILERDLASWNPSPVIEELMPRLVEDSIREILAEKTGLTESVIEEKDYDIDACLLKFKKPEIVLEVKWKSKIDKEDIAKAEANLNKVDAKRKILFVQDKKGINSSLEVMDVEDLLKNGF